MSFTAQVKDELSRVEGSCENCKRAELSALIRVCGTLSFRGPGRYSIRISTETGAVARMVIKLTRSLYGLETALTVRRSVLHKTRNYLIEIPEQDGLEEALYDLGILVPNKGLARGVEPRLVKRKCCLVSYIRGAFMAGGFIADPRGGFHLEIAVTGHILAEQIVRLLGVLGVDAKLNHRRGAYAIYVKTCDDIVRLLRLMGGKKSAQATENVRAMKSVKNDVNRKVNAELANQARSVSAAAEQIDLINLADELIGINNLPPAVKDFCVLRRDYPTLSLRDLGEQCSPRLSKSALNHRMRRLRSLVEEAQNNK